MNKRELLALLSHDALPAPLGLACAEELEYGGIGKDTQLLLVTTVEAIICETLPTYHTTTRLKPLQSARNLVKDQVIGRRLWDDFDKIEIFAAVEQQADLTKLLDYWLRCRRHYRKLEKQ